MGAFRQSFDKTCTKDGCNEIAKDFSLLLQRIIQSPSNVHSKYGYFRKYSFGFFPPNKLDVAELMDNNIRLRSLIFRHRPLTFIDEGQGELFN